MNHSKLAKIAFALALMFTLSICGGIAMAASEQDVMAHGQDGYVSLEQYVTPVGDPADGIFQVDMSIEVQASPPTMDVVFLVDASKSMQGTVGGKSYIDLATDGVYRAANILLNSAKNPHHNEGTEKIRIFVTFYNGAAYDSVDAVIAPGNPNTVCYVADPAKVSGLGGTPATTVKSLGALKADLDAMAVKVNGASGNVGSAKLSLLGGTKPAFLQRYTAAGLAAVYDTFADYSGTGVPGVETDRKVVIFLSNGPDFESEAPLNPAASATSEVGGDVAQEGAMRAEAIFIAKALKMEAQNRAAANPTFATAIVAGQPNNIDLYTHEVTVDATGYTHAGTGTFPTYAGSVLPFEFKLWGGPHSSASTILVNPTITPSYVTTTGNFTPYTSPLTATYNKIASAAGGGQHAEFLTIGLMTDSSTTSASYDSGAVTLRSNGQWLDRQQQGADYYTDFTGWLFTDRSDSPPPANSGSVDPYTFSTYKAATTPRGNSPNAPAYQANSNGVTWYSKVVWDEAFTFTPATAATNITHTQSHSRWPNSPSDPSISYNGVKKNTVAEYLHVLSGVYVNPLQGMTGNWKNTIQSFSASAQGWLRTHRTGGTDAFDNFIRNKRTSPGPVYSYDLAIPHSATPQSGTYYHNQDFQNYHEGLQVTFDLDGYEKAIKEFTTSGNSKADSADPATKEDYKVQTAFINTFTSPAFDELGMQYEDYAYELFRVSPTNQYITNVLSEWFELYKHPDKPMFTFNVETPIPLRYLGESATGAAGTRTVQWKFDHGLFTDSKYRVQFFVKMVGDTDPNTFYPFYDDTFTDHLRVRTMKRVTSGPNVGLMTRLTVVKNFPYPVIQGRNPKSITLHTPEPIKGVAESTRIGVFPEGTPMPVYTPSALADENVDEGVDEIEMPNTGDSATIGIIFVACLSLAAVYFTIKKRKESK